MTATVEELYDPALDLLPDPLADLRLDQRINRGDRELWHESDGAGCRATHDGMGDGYGTCSRQPHPSHWKHIAAGGTLVVGIWGGDPHWVAPSPADGSEPEPVEVTPLEVGQLVKFRNRRDVMLVVGLRKLDPTMPGAQGVEVLDLTHERYRVLRREQLVGRPADAPPLTAEQTVWVAKHVAKARADVRSIALRELQTGRFDQSTLNSVLNELGLEPYVPMYRGSGQLYIRYEVPQGAEVPGRDRYGNRDAVLRHVREAVQQMIRESGQEIGIELTDTYIDRPRLS